MLKAPDWISQEAVDAADVVIEVSVPLSIRSAPPKIIRCRTHY